MTKFLALDLTARALPTNWQKSILPPTWRSSLANFLDSNQTASSGKRRTNFFGRANFGSKPNSPLIPADT
jgi:hypothetical protein